MSNCIILASRSAVSCSCSSSYKNLSLNCGGARGQSPESTLEDDDDGSASFLDSKFRAFIAAHRPTSCEFLLDTGTDCDDKLDKLVVVVESVCGSDDNNVAGEEDSERELKRGVVAARDVVEEDAVDTGMDCVERRGECLVKGVADEYSDVAGNI